VIITSNNEKGLPDAFLRRCVFHHINFPDKTQLLSIVKANLKMENTFFQTAIDKFMEIRKANLAKQPATSELIDWIACLNQKDLLNNQLENWGGADPDYIKRLTDTLGIIAKTKTDYETLKKKIEG
jgi:MoxR-like ATPase